MNNFFNTDVNFGKQASNSPPPVSEDMLQQIAKTVDKAKGGAVTNAWHDLIGYKGGGIAEKTKEQIAAAAEELKRGYQKESKTYGDKGAAMDILNRGPVTDYLGSAVDLPNAALQFVDYLQTKVPGLSEPESVMDSEGNRIPKFPLSTEEPYGGKNAWNKLLQQVGVTSDVERPIAETAASLASPFAPAAAKKVVTAAKKLAPTAAEMMLELSEKYGVSPRQFALPNDPKKAPPKVQEYQPQLTQDEQNLIDLFNKKAEREAQLSKKVAKQAKAEPKEKGTASGRKGAIPADYFRTMLNEQGEDAVLRAAKAGEHLKRDAYGNYVGFPRTVTSPQALGALRGSLDEQFEEGVKAIRQADPERLGTWYDRAKQGQAMSNEPHQLDRALEQHSVYSAGVSPESELAFALKHRNTRGVGMPGMAYRGAGMRTLDEAEAANKEAELGFKIGEYGEKNDPRVPNASPFGVNDFRFAQSFGYTDPAGDIWKGGVSPTMHPVMDAETALLVDRANQANVGGRSTWSGPHVQEVPWVLGKAQDLYSRGKNARYAGSPLEGIKAAIQDANNTALDYMYKHAASATHEAIPGASTGHVPSMLNATDAEKAAYTAAGRWDQPPSYSLPDAPTVGAGNRDVLYSALNFRQLPSVESTGAYMNSAGQMEYNPMTMSRPLFDFPTGGGGKAAPQTVKTAEAVETLRAVLDAQEAGALNLPNTGSSAPIKNALVLDSRTKNLDDPTLGTQPTKQQLADLNKLLENTGYGVGATSRGVTIFPFDNDAMGAKELSKLIKEKGKEFQNIFPSKLMKSQNTSIYTPGIGKFGDDGIIPTTPHTGEATVAALQKFAGLPQSVARNISESEAVRNSIRARIERDAALPGARKDIQNTRNFFAEEDWAKTVELARRMMKRGLNPAGALTALGYSLNSLAGEKE